MTSLETRKQLLLTESELNRLHLVEELGLVKEELCRLADKARSWGAVASSATALAARAGAAISGRNGNEERFSWSATLAHGARAALSIWLALRARDR